MKILLNTHIVFWAILEPEKLSNKAKNILESQESELLISSISLFEFAIKFSLQKLSYKGGLQELFNDIDNLGAQIIFLKMKIMFNMPNYPFIIATRLID